MLGPVVDVELVDPPDKAPPGVVFGIKHLLTVPNSPDVQEALEQSVTFRFRNFSVSKLFHFF